MRLGNSCALSLEGGAGSDNREKSKSFPASQGRAEKVVNKGLHRVLRHTRLPVAPLAQSVWEDGGDRSRGWGHLSGEVSEALQQDRDILATTEDSALHLQLYDMP